VQSTALASRDIPIVSRFISRQDFIPPPPVSRRIGAGWLPVANNLPRAATRHLGPNGPANVVARPAPAPAGKTSAASGGDRLFLASGIAT
jgi:hypothetical protein